MSQHANNVASTVSGAPGTGTITLGSAVTGSQSFASAYGANATVDVFITDGNAWEVARACTYTHSGTTLTRGTFEASSTGVALTLTSSAVVRVAASADSGRRWDAAALEQSTVTGTSGAITAEVNKLYVADMSGWTADRTLTLPASAQIGDRVGVMVSVGDASYEWLITAASGDTLNAIAGGTEWSRVFITGEVVVMRCVAANSTWVVEQDGRIPQFAHIYLSTGADGETASTATLPTSKGGAWSTVSQVGDTITLSDGRVTVRRSGNYGISVRAIPKDLPGAADTGYFVLIYVDGAEAAGTGLYSPVNIRHNVVSSCAINLAADKYIQLYYSSTPGGIGLISGTAANNYSYLDVSEIL